MIASVGLLIPDITMSVSRLPLVGESIEALSVSRSEGGKAANQLVAAARLGASTAFLGIVGSDPAHPSPLAALVAEGVDVSGATVVGEPNGFSVILLAEGGDQVIVTDNGPGRRVEVPRVLTALERLGASLLLLQGETEVESTLAVGRSFTGTVILDPSPAAEFVGMDLSFVDVLTPNESEARLLAGSADADAQRVREVTGARQVVVTRGSAGADIATAELTLTVPAPPTDVLDPTGAGDAFNGALAASLAEGASITDAVEFATRAAAYSVARLHCIPSYPTRADLAPDGVELLAPSQKEDRP